MDMIWVVAIFVVFIAGLAFLFIKWFDSTYPVVKIRTKKRGTKVLSKYRLLGDAIVADNVIALLSGNIQLRGFLSWLDYNLEGNDRVYEGYLCGDFILRIDEKEVPERKPVIDLGHGKKGEIGDDFILPLKCSDLNYEQGTPDIVKGKMIVGKFITAARENKQYVEQSNPVITMILSILPNVIILAITFVGLYFVLQMVLDKTDSILTLLNKLNGIIPPGNSSIG